MDPPIGLEDAVLAAWNTSSRVTEYLIEQMPAVLWSAAVPGVPSRTIRAIGAHLHNARCNWTRTLGREHGVVAPARVDHRAVTRRQLGAALRRSGRGIAAQGRAGGAVSVKRTADAPRCIGWVVGYSEVLREVPSLQMVNRLVHRFECDTCDFRLAF